MKEKWLVISNCQTVGLGNSLSLLCPKVEIDACDIWKFRSEADSWKTRIADYDQLIINPEIQNLGLVDFSILPNVTWIPGFYFRGFHPDLCYVFCGEAGIKGPMDDYHSLIAFTAFKQGLSAEKARNLFSAEVYERLGFLALWESEKKGLFDNFEAYGLNIRTEFVKWIREGGFMHSVNHPRIGALYDVARKVARKLQAGAVAESGIVPHDNLIAAPIYPVYPEISELFGLGKGSYYFKTLATYKVLSLEEFIDQSYKTYKTFNFNDLNVRNPHYDRAVGLIKELA